MPNDGTSAIVVTYFPDADVAANLAALQAQVRQVIVVDNGSPPEALLMLRRLSESDGLTLIENGTNLGIATALNIGVQHARQQAADFVLLFDQDSCVTEGYVQAMLGCFAASPLGNKLAILVPCYVDSRFGTVLTPPRLGDPASALLEAATTSGSLMPASIFTAAGFFADELFIDGVDYEYSLRVRRLGYAIAECPEAILMHSPGTPSTHTLLGSKPFQAANYSPVRRFYQERNKVWAARRYLLTFPSFILGQFLTSAKDLLKIVLVEQDKAVKIRSFFRGLWHGLLGRTGKMPPGR